MDVYPQPPGAPGPAPNPGRRTRLGAAITCAALSFLILIGSGLAWAAFQNFSAGVPHGAPVPPLPAGASDPDGKDQNILLVGNDSRAGASPSELRALSTQNDGGSVNTDTMMVLHVPSDGANATVVSFPRDSWVTIPGHGQGKINSAYGIGYAAAKSAGQAVPLANEGQGLPGGDLDRIKRQQYFLGAAFRKITSAGVLLNPFKLRDLLTAVGSSVLTDPSLQLLKLGQEFQQMSAGKITFKTIPNLGPQLIYPDGVETSVVKVDTAAMPGFIRGLQGKAADPALAAAKPAAASSVTVDVLNATGTTGWAGLNAAALRTLGFKVNLVDSADASPDTVVEYPTGMESAAKAVGAAAPGAQLVLTSTVARPTLVLGGNQVHVTGVHTQTAARTAPAPAKKPATSAAASPASKTQGLGCIN